MTIVRIAVAALLLSLTGVGAAQNYPAQGYDDSRPQRGMTMQAVERTWGSPNLRRAAIGEPPITRWEYAEFTVYFEYDRVIHAVLNRQRPAG